MSFPSKVENRKWSPKKHHPIGMAGRQSKRLPSVPCAIVKCTNLYKYPTLRLALGDNGNPQKQYVEVLDNNTVVLSLVSGTSTTAAQWMDRHGRGTFGCAVACRECGGAAGICLDHPSGAHRVSYGTDRLHDRGPRAGGADPPLPRLRRRTNTRAATPTNTATLQRNADQHGNEYPDADEPLHQHRQPRRRRARLQIRRRRHGPTPPTPTVTFTLTPPPGAANGFNFRATSGFVTDAGDETYDVGSAYPVTRTGRTFGWEQAASHPRSLRPRSTTA